MDTLPLLAIAGAAVGGAVAGAVVCYWPLSRVIIELRRRLAHSEQARAGAVEGSARAREQIAQLNRAITELRRVRSTPAAVASSRDTVEQASAKDEPVASSRESVEKALAEGDQKHRELSPQGVAPAFADTQVMGNL